MRFDRKQYIFYKVYMPYFKNENILFIHIPKTGGTSIDSYFLNKYNEEVGVDKLIHPFIKYKNVAYQHLQLQVIYNQRNEFNIDFDNIQIITIVRNPYHRIMSELAFLHLVKDDTSPEITYEHIQNLIIQHNYGILRDNHIRSQYDMLTLNGKIPDNIKILRTENLNQMMHDMGYIDFNLYEHTTSYFFKGILLLLDILEAMEVKVKDCMETINIESYIVGR